MHISSVLVGTSMPLSMCCVLSLAELKEWGKLNRKNKWITTPLLPLLKGVFSMNALIFFFFHLSHKSIHLYNSLVQTKGGVRQTQNQSQFERMVQAVSLAHKIKHLLWALGVIHIWSFSHLKPKVSGHSFHISQGWYEVEELFSSFTYLQQCSNTP